MNREEMILELQSIAPFDRLEADEIATLSEVAHARSFLAGELIFRRGRPVTGVSIVLKGSVRNGPERVLGLVSALYGLPAPADVVAGVSGAFCWQIRRGQLFTIVHECPEILAWLLETAPDLPQVEIKP